MNLKRFSVGALSALLVALGGESLSLAAPHPAPVPSSATASDAVQGSHASLRLDVAQPKAWVGQAFPITLRAYFHDAEGVTIEGAPQIVSSGVYTSQLTPEPRQATEVIGGEPVLVATWSGKVTAAASGPLTIAAELPVRVRYRDRAPRVEMTDPFGGDPFQGLGVDPFDALGGSASNPFDPSLIQRFFASSMQQPLGRSHDETITLRTSQRHVDIDALPSANQPPTFSGAIGRFHLKASLSSAHALVSEPLTLAITADGEGDLDRVDLTGVESSDVWKAYPPKATIETPVKGGPSRKVFEQVLIPLRSGAQKVPAVSLTAFDPVSGQYVTRETLPLEVIVTGTSVAAKPMAESLPPPTAPLANPPPHPVDARILALLRAWTPSKNWLWVFPASILGSVALFASRARRRDEDRSLRRAMRKAAARGDIVPFYRAAHGLIEKRLAARWGMATTEVTAPVIREHLGPEGAMLAEALDADETLRFGRGTFDDTDLVPLCSSIERSLGRARMPALAESRH